MNRMKIAIRVDASLEIGTGHVMRCLTLAQEIRRKSGRVVFICREHIGHMCDMISNNGFELVRLGLDQESDKNSIQKYENRGKHDQPIHLPWLGVNQYRDAMQTKEAILIDSPWDWLIVDHYGIDNRWESIIREISNNIMVIDDLADREHDCDLLIDQNYFQEPAKRYEGLLPDNSKTLLGPKFALLRPEFRQARKFNRMRGNGVARVLVYFGGNDPNNLTGMTLEALSSPELGYLFVEAVVGSNNQYLEKLEKQAQNRPGTRLHIQPEGFVELMIRADICIGAGGTTTWERLCLDLPSIVITVAKNQEAFIKELDTSGYVKWIGKLESISVKNIKNKLILEIYNLENREILSVSSFLLDGFGALRVTEMIIPSLVIDLKLRKATMKDMKQYFVWANDPIVRKNSFCERPIDWEEHVNWYTRKVDSKNSGMWVLQTSQGLPIGQIRFDDNGVVANISYSLDSAARGRGWGLKLVEMGINKNCNLKEMQTIQAKVKKTNIASQKVFLQLGFSETENYDCLIFTKEQTKK